MNPVPVLSRPYFERPFAWPTLRVLRRFPESGPVRPDIAPGARPWSSPPYLILYRIIPEGVHIVRVLHGARNIDKTLFIEGVE
jgi:plasmid stabilization system protein ParE